MPADMCSYMHDVQIRTSQELSREVIPTFRISIPISAELTLMKMCHTPPSMLVTSKYWALHAFNDVIFQTASIQMLGVCKIPSQNYEMPSQKREFRTNSIRVYVKLGTRCV